MLYLFKDSLFLNKHLILFLINTRLIYILQDADLHKPLGNKVYVININSKHS